MKNSSLKIWSNVKYDDSALEFLYRETTGHQLIIATGPIQADTALLNADVAFGQPDADVVRRSETLRWIHLDSAGYEKYDVKAIYEALRRRGAQLSNSSGVYDEPCAEHLLAMMMSIARRLPQACENQLRDRSWPMMELRSSSYLLTGQTALILGFGAIARRLVELLTPLRMNLFTVRRQKVGDEPIPVIPESELGKHLPLADHIIDILPINSTTRYYINEARLSAMKRGAIFYNIGRGATVDHKALAAALVAGHLAAAYLDVTEPEPLPPEHPLWTAPNCFITPHTAGGHIGEKERLVHHFLNNLRRFVAGEELIDRII
ncbi:MAG: D-2-hydroxyacid dehydrogenase [Blastocatellia bacterium]|nr:D-2-hydroxyacid dehydrogenase [Blastocatellia bacterium]